jgi:hypothetical protein
MQTSLTLITIFLSALPSTIYKHKSLYKESLIAENYFFNSFFSPICFPGMAKEILKNQIKVISCQQ